MTAPLTWILQSDTFAPHYRRYQDAVDAAGHRRVEWAEQWRDLAPNDCLRTLAIDGPAVFHGSLGTAHHIQSTLGLTPGAYCDEPAFRCSTWYPRAAHCLVHRAWSMCTAEELVGDPEAKAGHFATEVEGERRVFVRPDSPLKHFSGRVVDLGSLSLESLDHGYYYDDATLPVIVCPLEEIGREWRFVVAAGEVVAGSGYEAFTRSACAENDIPFERAQEIASTLEPPEDVYVLDLCESRGELRLMELNPFSGADLYNCHPVAVVDALARAISGGSI